MSMTPIDIAKVYLANSSQYNHMEDGNYTVDNHDSALDAHTIKELPGVDPSDTHDNDYSVVTIEKNVQVDGPGDITIPKIVKVQVSNIDNSVQSVIESK